MNFKLKNAAYKAMEVIPNGEKIYSFMQKYVTKSVKKKMSNNEFVTITNEKVISLLEKLHHYSPKELSKSTVFEFGAGWDLHIPLGTVLLAEAGKYVCADRISLLQPSLVQNNIRLYAENKDRIKSMYLKRCRKNISSIYEETDIEELFRDINNEKNIVEKLSGYLNIEYMAPCDASKTDFQDNEADIVVSNATLEHIPSAEIMSILTECHRIMKSGGIIYSVIDYRDHWAYSDKRLCEFSYMAYSDSEWGKYNPYMHYQNRLRHSDYLKIFDACGFEVIDVVTDTASDRGRAMFENLKIADKFKKYDKEDLLITGSSITARNR